MTKKKLTLKDVKYDILHKRLTSQLNSLCDEMDKLDEELEKKLTEFDWLSEKYESMDKEAANG